MEFIGRIMPEDFEEFLRDRVDMGNVYETKSAPVEQVLLDAGMSLSDAGKAAAPILDAMLRNEEAAYSRGVKDGALLMLHLLGMAPENKKEVSQ
ncbi:MAG: hypothetical protein ABSA82_00400 [Thermacetogeniaceae bacterium]